MLTATLIALALAAGAAADATLKVTLSGAESFGSIADAIVTATVTNMGNAAVKVLNEPSTVLSKSPTNKFAIKKDDGASPLFKGVSVKFIPTADLDFVSIGPGENFTVNHALADAYDFSKSGPGVYTITTSRLLKVIADGVLEDARAAVVVHSARLVGEGGGVVKRDSPAPVGCTGSRVAILERAAGKANLLVSTALTYLKSPPAPPARYTTWFGNASNLPIVKSHFSILQTLDFSNFTFDCTSCTTPGVAATTSAAKPGIIALCPTYWTLNETGADSRAGVLIQQAVQWTSVAGASVFATGLLECQSLASADPDLAVENADSHEYFAENPTVAADPPA